MPTFHALVPYEQQASPRRCGAAALCMVYRSLGMTVTQDEVWPTLTTATSKENPSARTHRLAADALCRRLAALVVQALDPWSFLELCRRHQTRVILNHRSTLQSWTGHYSVLVHQSADRVLVHDPHFGPNRQISREELLQLWRPTAHPQCEITGNAVVAIAATPGETHACSVCAAGVPESLPCP